jgi:hypothetical protein
MVLVFVATTVALEVSFAVGWWVMKKSVEATYYVSKNTAVALYNVYQDPPEWLYVKERLATKPLAIEG